MQPTGPTAQNGKLYCCLPIIANSRYADSYICMYVFMLCIFEMNTFFLSLTPTRQEYLIYTKHITLSNSIRGFFFKWKADTGTPFFRNFSSLLCICVTFLYFPILSFLFNGLFINTNINHTIY